MAAQAQREVPVQTVVRLQRHVTLFAVLLLHDLAVHERRRSADEEVGRGLADVVERLARDRVRPREREPHGVRAVEEHVSLQLSVSAAERGRVVDRREIGRRERHVELVLERVGGALLGARGDVGLLGDQALVVEGGSGDQGARAGHLEQVPSAAVVLPQAERDRHVIAGTEESAQARSAARHS